MTFAQIREGMMDWSGAIGEITPHVCRIETPNGWGTGFLAFYNGDRTWCGIATAAHVVAYADEWQQPIRIRNATSTRFLNVSGDRVIFLDRPNDSAIVLFVKGDLQLPELPIALMPMGQPCPIGADVGWLGYPAIEPDSLCFFSGSVSAIGNSRYLIDGVAINGVSGGPVFHCSNAKGVQIIGCVSAYHANKITGDTLPGLLRAQDVSHFHAAAATVRNIDEGERKKREFEEQQNRNQAGMASAMGEPATTG